MIAIIKRILIQLKTPQTSGFYVPFRHLLLNPFLFSLLSITLQLWHVRNIQNVQSPKFAETGYKKWIFDYNFNKLKSKKFLVNRRAEPLLRLASTLIPFTPKTKMLIVGPLQYHELLLAWIYGIKWSNISAVDMISISKKITVQDMEDMTFDNEFDVVISSCVLSCAEDLSKATHSAVKALRQGGVYFYQAVHSHAEKEFISERVSLQEHKEILSHCKMNIILESQQAKVTTTGIPHTSFYLGSQKSV